MFYWDWRKEYSPEIRSWFISGILSMSSWPTAWRTPPTASINCNMREIWRDNLKYINRLKQFYRKERISIIMTQTKMTKPDWLPPSKKGQDTRVQFSTLVDELKKKVSLGPTSGLALLSAISLGVVNPVTPPDSASQAPTILHSHVRRLVGKVGTTAWRGGALHSHHWQW